jgi:endonuclease YncB( thermonuclease family)
MWGRAAGMSLLLSLASLGFSQGVTAEEPAEPKFRFQAECGDPLRESMGWLALQGRVSDVPDGNTIIVRINHEKRTRRVHLVAMRSPSGSEPGAEEARLGLRRMVINQRILVAVNAESGEAAELTGYVETSEDIIFKMVELGLAQYQKPEAYTISDYTACTYRMIEKEAKKERRGIWKQADH